MTTTLSSEEQIAVFKDMVRSGHKVEARDWMPD